MLEYATVDQVLLVTIGVVAFPVAVTAITGV
jgi:hypothetical protein